MGSLLTATGFNFPWLDLLPAGPAEVLAALTASCCDGVLAVRISAGASLAAFCQMLGQAATEDAVCVGSRQSPAPARTSSPAACGAAAVIAASVLPGCLQLATAAARDSDKLRPSSLQALGSLFSLQSVMTAGQQAAGKAAPAQQRQQQQLWASAGSAVQECLLSGSVRVQWAACETAGHLLACSAPEVQPCWPAVLDNLLTVLGACPNFRTRVLAAAALRQLGVACSLPPEVRVVSLLDDVAGSLFEGEFGAGLQRLCSLSCTAHNVPRVRWVYCLVGSPAVVFTGGLLVGCARLVRVLFCEVAAS